MQLSNGTFVHKDLPIYSGSNFTWGEATKNLIRPIQDLVIDGKLYCASEEIERNIIAVARYMDEIREKLGNRPLIVTSWYRPTHVNNRVGGSKWSRHQYGDAVDFRSNYLHPHQVYKLLDGFHKCGGLGRYYSFTHVDIRGKKARW